MQPPRYRAFTCLAVLFAMLLQVRADTATLGGEVVVAGVHFGLVAGRGGRWHETQIEVAVRPAADNPTRYVSRVKVVLELGYDAPGRNGARLEFYRSEATAVAVERGRAQFRFYLPPEIVERDRVTGDLRYYHITLSAAGVEMPPDPRQSGPGLDDPAALANFRSQVAARAGENEGMLFPQHHAPLGARGASPPGPTLLR